MKVCQGFDIILDIVCDSFSSVKFYEQNKNVYRLYFLYSRNHYLSI